MRQQDPREFNFAENVEATEADDAARDEDAETARRRAGRRRWARVKNYDARNDGRPQ